MKINLGSGARRIEGFINVDGFEGNKPDLVLDITKQKLPYPDDSVDELVFFHCIEHIEEQYHRQVLDEIWRVLKPEALFIISYPEFLRCVEAYKTNMLGHREFFKATIYGRQAHPGDFHVSLMDSQFFKTRLIEAGFEVRAICEESPSNPYYTVVSCRKGIKWVTREEILKNEIFT